MNNISYILKFSILIILVDGYVKLSTAEKIKKNAEDNTEDNDTNGNDFSLDIATPETEIASTNCSRRQNDRMHEITVAKEKQFPYMAAIMSPQQDFMCSGSVVSNGLILTTADCTNKGVRYVLLNTTKAKKQDAAVMLSIIKTEKFPTYTGGDDALKNVGLIYTEKHNNSIASKIKLSNYTNLNSITDIECFGFGLNADLEQERLLQFVGTERRSQMGEENLIGAYFDCVETKVRTCFRDKGGPAIFDNELIGIIVAGQNDCLEGMSVTVAYHKKLADILPTYNFKAWLEDRIKKNEEQEKSLIPTYPSQPNLRGKLQKMTSKNAGDINVNSVNLLLPVFYLVVN